MSITRFDPITVTVTDTDGLQVVDIFVDQTDKVREIAYSSAAGGESVGAGDFGAQYVDTGRVAVTDGFDYTFSRLNGWRGATVTIIVHAIDAAGELTITSEAYDVTDPVVLEITALSPTPSATPGDVGAFSADAATARHTPITFEVHGAQSVLVTVRYVGSTTTELVFNGAGFTDGFDTDSFFDQPTNDLDWEFSVIPNGGWRGSIECLNCMLFDDLGGFTNLGEG